MEVYTLLMPATDSDHKPFYTSAAGSMHRVGGPVVLFDGDCRLCSYTVQFILRHDKKQIFGFYSRQSVLGKQMLVDQGMARCLDSVILSQDGRVYVRSGAIIHIAELLGGFYRLASGLWIIPRFMRDALYDFIASHRYSWFGRNESCTLAEPGDANHTV